MNMKRTMTKLVLITALLMTATWVCAELPAQEPNIWAPTGDVVGTANHGTMTMEFMNTAGFSPKALEDWQRNDSFGGSFLFGMNAVGEAGNLISVKSNVFNQLDGNINGHLTMGCTQPGQRGWTFDYRGFSHRYDTTSELRNTSFGMGDMPPALDEVPSLDWNKTRFTMKYHVSDAFHLDGGFAQFKREGTKSSLLRDFRGVTAPAVKTFDTSTNQFWVKGNFNRDALAASLRFNMLSSTGNRDLGSSHSFTDDQLTWGTQLNASYAINEKMDVLGGGSYSHLANDQTEQLAANSYLPDSKAKTTAGHLGLVTRLGAATTVQLTGVFKKLDADGLAFNDDLTLAQSVVRDRTSNTFQGRISTTSLKKARIQAYYKYRSSDLVETVGMGGTAGNATSWQYTTQDQTRQDAGLKFRYRFDPKASLNGGLTWNKTEVTESSRAYHASDDLVYKMGDRDMDQLMYHLALGLKPTKEFKVDLGFEAIDQTYTLIDSGNAETNWTSQRGYVTANWMATPRLTVMASGSLGSDTYELIDGPVASAEMRPLLYDGTTLRFVPGVIYQVNDKLNLEAIYEGIRFEDKGDAADGSNQLNSDCDRILFRAGYDVSEKARLSLGYRRQEFTEDRFDDYTMDIYSVSVSGKF